MNIAGEKHVRYKLTAFLFSVYLITLVWILLFKLGVRFSYMETRRVNIIPFAQPLISNGKADAGEMILNVLIFIPFGIYAGILFSKSSGKIRLLMLFLSSLLLELLQFIFKVGAFDVTDIITNTAGGVMGLLIWATFKKLFSSTDQAHKLFNVVATAVTMVTVVFLFLLKLNMLPIRYQ